MRSEQGNVAEYQYVTYGITYIYEVANRKQQYPIPIFNACVSRATTTVWEIATSAGMVEDHQNGQAYFEVIKIILSFPNGEPRT